VNPRKDSSTALKTTVEMWALGVVPGFISREFVICHTHTHTRAHTGHRDCDCKAMNRSNQDALGMCVHVFARAQHACHQKQTSL
jgi:hypothetical protein